MPCFKAHQPAPPSSSPPESESSFVMCHASKLTNPLLPLPPLQLVSPRLCHAILQSSPTRSSLFLPSTTCVFICDMPCFKAHHPAPPSSSPPRGLPSFVTRRSSNLTNLLLPLPPLQQVSPRL